MSYFSNFPIMYYDFTAKTDINPIKDYVTDLTTKVTIDISDEELDRMCYHYTVSSNELPEHISLKFYNTLDLAWTIVYINNIASLDSDWPLRDIDLLNYVISKYGVNHVNDVHHYEKLPENIAMDYQFIVDNYGANNAIPITNLDYETSINAAKSMIYVIKPEFISDFVNRYFKELV